MMVLFPVFVFGDERFIRANIDWNLALKRILKMGNEGIDFSTCRLFNVRSFKAFLAPIEAGQFP